MPVVPFVVGFSLARVVGEEKVRAGVRHGVHPADVALWIRFATTSLNIRRDDGISLEVLIASVEVIQHHIGIDVDAHIVHCTNHPLQFGTTAIARFHTALLVVIPQIIMVVYAIAAIHDTPIALGRDGCPQAADACCFQFGCHLAQMIPPCAVLGLFVHGHIPIERLHHHIIKQSRLLFLDRRTTCESN